MTNRAPLLARQADSHDGQGMPEKIGTVIGAAVSIAVFALIAWPLVRPYFLNF